MLKAKSPWKWTAALGFPVLPDVKSHPAMSSASVGAVSRSSEAPSTLVVNEKILFRYSIPSHLNDLSGKISQADSLVHV